MESSGARWLTVAAVLASFFWMLGGAPLFDVDEGAFGQATLEMFRAARQRHENLGIVIQAYLRRSAGDIEALAREGAPARLIVSSRRMGNFTKACVMLTGRSRQPSRSDAC